MNDLRVTLVQTDLFWENPEANLASLEEKLWPLAGHTDLIVLPEMFNTGFSLHPERLAEVPNLHTTRWMKRMAQHTNALLIGSLMIRDQGHHHNRLLWVQPDGHIAHYDKKHLFIGAEQQRFVPGQQRLTAHWRGWNICPLICYDLRFPVWSRNTPPYYDLLLYIASWPQSRRTAWQTLLPARAVENASYCIGLNRVGQSPDEIFDGYSSICDFKGHVLYQQPDKEDIHTHTLAAAPLQAYRQKFPVLSQADPFTLHQP